MDGVQTRADLFVRSNLPVEVLFRKLLEIFEPLGMVGVHLCDCGVQHGITARGHFLGVDLSSRYTDKMPRDVLFLYQLVLPSESRFMGIYDGPGTNPHRQLA